MSASTIPALVILATVVGAIALLTLFAHAAITGWVDGAWSRRLSVPRGRVWQGVYEWAYQRVQSSQEKGEARAREHEERLRKGGKL